MKGKQNEECYRLNCVNMPAIVYNWLNRKYYCQSCADKIVEKKPFHFVEVKTGTKLI